MTDAWWSRWVFERMLAIAYVIAFAVTINQFRPLLGERGLLPAPRYLRAAGWRNAPSLFHIRYSDRLLVASAWLGVAVGIALLVDLPQRGPLGVSLVAWLVVWVLYLSIVNIGQVFYGFGWESLLLEAGFLAAFLGNNDTAPPILVLLLLRWLLFRVEFGAGLIKIRGDPCWRDLTCLDYHHETQPMPNPLSWYFHHLPKPLHRVEVAANHVAQLVIPWLLFAPEPLATIGALVIVVTQCWLVLSGNFSWLNFLTIALALSAVNGSLLSDVLPVDRPALQDTPDWYSATVIAVFAAVVVMSYWPARNLLSRRQLMNASFNRLHLVNSYGAFGSVTRVRHELEIEGASADAGEWLAYEFKGKPGTTTRRPRQVAPYHLRIDWLMWFAALSPPRAERWLRPLVAKLLAGDPATLRLVATNPFPAEPPAYIRVRMYRYRFTTRQERRDSGAWWSRTLVGEISTTAR